MLPGVHPLFAARINHSGAVNHAHIFLLQAHAHQQIYTGNTGSTSARDHQFYLRKLFFDYAQTVVNSRRSHNSSAVLVVVKHRNLHALTQFFLHHKTFRRFNVFKIDTTKSGFQAGNNIHQFIHIGLVYLNIKHINIGKLFKQYRLALHHRFRRQRAYITQPQNRSAIGYYRDKVTSGGHRGDFSGVFGNQLTGMGHTRGVGQRQVAFIGQRFSGSYF